MKKNGIMLILVGMLVLLFDVIPVVAVNPYDLWLYPKEGTIYTDIVLRTRRNLSGIDDIDYIDIIWDEAYVITSLHGVRSADGSYNFHLMVPNVDPISRLGNHTLDVGLLFLPMDI